MSFIEFKHIGKKYAGAEHKSVDDFNLNIEEKEFIAFVGPSGCGKSTTLRMIAGFEEITEGDLYIDGKRVNETAPRDRGIAMVFQNYALYPHMTVEKNIGYGLKNMKMPADQIKKKVDWAIDILGLQEFRYRKPKNLSGGQRQRVALGRAIVKNQKVFLMDEPLSNLDAKLRVSMRTEISKLHREMGATTIYVTHDQVEAMTMADRIVIMKEGVIQQVGKPMELYDHPVNKFVAGFIGSPQMNFFDVTLKGNEVTFEDGNKLMLPEAILKKLNGKGFCKFTSYDLGFLTEAKLLAHCIRPEWNGMHPVNVLPFRCRCFLNIFKKHLCILLFFCCSQKDIVCHSCIQGCDQIRGHISVCTHLLIFFVILQSPLTAGKTFL